MPYEIVLGRESGDKEKYGITGSVLVGKQYVKIGQVTALAQPVYLDLNRAHVVFVAGKRGSGKSYAMSVIAEGIGTLPENMRNQLAVIMLDTMGIFWTMKYPNRPDEALLKEYGLNSKGIENLKIYTPVGYYKQYKEKGIPTDAPFSLKPAELSPDDWWLTFDLNPIDPLAVFIERIVLTLKKEKGDYDMQDIIDAIVKDEKEEHQIKNAAESRFRSAEQWGLFSKDGTPIRELAKGGQITVLDVSAYAVMPNGWKIKHLTVGIVCRKLFIERMIVRKDEEYASIHKSMHYLVEEDDEKGKKEDKMPIVWLEIDECLPYNSEVITSKAHTPIGEIIEKIENGEDIKVWSFNEVTGDYGYYPVEKVYRKGKRKILKLVTETGTELKCTFNHRILTKDGFVYSALAENIGTPASQHYDQNKNSIIARLFGHILGDGWLSVNKTAGFSGKGDNNDLIKIKKDLENIGLKSGNIYSRKTKSLITNSHGQTFNVNGTSQSIHYSLNVFNFFNNLKAPVGEKVAQSYALPEWLINGSEKEKSEFLGALFGSDGNAPSVSKNVKCDFNPARFSFNKFERLKNSGFEYGKTVIKLLADLGITAKLSLRNGNIRKDGNKTIKFVISVDKQTDNMIRFLEKVGYRYCEKKEIKGCKWLAYLKFRKHRQHEREVLRKKAIDLHKKEGLGKHKIAKLLGIKVYEAREWIYYPTKAWLPKNLPGFNEWINERYKNKTIFEKIIKKEYAGEEEVFDISVKETHNFISNGCVVHNCHEFLPTEGKTAASDALITLLREGRQPGIAMVMVTQQPGKIHTDALTQSDIILAHRLTAKLDIDALGAIIQNYLRSGLSKELDLLPKVPGACLAVDDVNERIFPMRVRPKFSWHGGGAPKIIIEKKGIFEL